MRHSWSFVHFGALLVCFALFFEVKFYAKVAFHTFYTMFVPNSISVCVKSQSKLFPLVQYLALFSKWCADSLKRRFSQSLQPMGLGCAKGKSLLLKLPKCTCFKSAQKVLKCTSKALGGIGQNWSFLGHICRDQLTQLRLDWSALFYLLCASLA